MLKKLNKDQLFANIEVLLFLALCVDIYMWHDLRTHEKGRTIHKPTTGWLLGLRAEAKEAVLACISTFTSLKKVDLKKR